MGSCLHSLCVIALCLRVIAAGSFFPCHVAKGSSHDEVKCASVKLPRSLCAHCPLRETFSDGSFQECDRIYDTSSSQCIQSLQQYVDDNPCDIRRSAALKQLYNGDESARNEMDYFLYSVCEQCCDCVPMGVRAVDYIHLSERHSSSSPTLWSETRGNCPAHARYDVCKIFPSIKSFGLHSSDVPICAQLINWVDSDAAVEWQTNPEVGINDDIQRFLRDILVATQCDDHGIWRKCQIMEDKQHHLDLPSGFESEISPPVDTGSHLTPAPIAEVSDAVTDLPVSGVESLDSSSENTDDGSEENSSEGEITAPVQSASAENAEELIDSESDGTANSTGISSSVTNVGEGITNVSDGIGSHKPQVLQGIRSCFPGSSTVRRRDGALMRMEEVQIGDEILVSNGRYSPVYTFSHRSHDIYSEFVQIRTENHSLLLTSEHYLYVNGRKRHAGLVTEGDYVYGLNGSERVVKIERQWSWGLFNPHTVDGHIVVDGVLCSCFTGAVPVGIAQGLLAPLRGVFMTCSENWLLGLLLRDGLQSLLFWNV